MKTLDIEALGKLVNFSRMGTSLVGGTFKYAIVHDVRVGSWVCGGAYGELLENS